MKNLKKHKTTNPIRMFILPSKHLKQLRKPKLKTTISKKPQNIELILCVNVVFEYQNIFLNLRKETFFSI